HPVPMAHEETVAGTRAAGLRGGARRRTRAQALDHAAVISLEVQEARHRRAQREPLRIGRVDAADERIGNALEGFAPAPTARARREALVVVVVAAARQDEVERHAELAAPGEEP